MVPLVSFLVSVSIAVVQVLTPLRRKERAKTRLPSEFGNQIGECRLYVRNFSTIVIVAESVVAKQLPTLFIEKRRTCGRHDAACIRYTRVFLRYTGLRLAMAYSRLCEMHQVVAPIIWPPSVRSFFPLFQWNRFIQHILASVPYPAKHFYHCC